MDLWIFFNGNDCIANTLEPVLPQKQKQQIALKSITKTQWMNF